MITIPAVLWDRMLDEFQSERRSVEQVAYFDGVVFRDGELCVGAATTLTIPNAELKSGQFSVSAEAMSQAGKHFRKYGLQRLAQVHTHPTEWTGHSAWDDEWAYSQMLGAISVVLPNFAKAMPQLRDAGVHFREKEGWRQLSPSEVEKRLRIVPATLDFRDKSNQSYETKHIVTPRRRRWWDSLTFWRNKAS